MALEGLAQQATTDPKLGWQPLPGDPAGRPAAQLIIGPSLQQGHLVGAARRKAKVEAGGEG